MAKSRRIGRSVAVAPGGEVEESGLEETLAAEEGSVPTEIVDLDEDGEVVEAAPDPAPAPALPKPFPFNRNRALKAAEPVPVETKVVAPKSTKVPVRCLVNSLTQYGAYRLRLKAGDTIEVSPEIAAWLRRSGRAV